MNNKVFLYIGLTAVIIRFILSIYWGISDKLWIALNIATIAAILIMIYQNKNE